MFSQQRNGLFLNCPLSLFHSLKQFFSVHRIEACSAIQRLIKFLWEAALKTTHMSLITAHIKVVMVFGDGGLGVSAQGR